MYYISRNYLISKKKLSLKFWNEIYLKEKFKFKSFKNVSEMDPQISHSY